MLLVVVSNDSFTFTVVQDTTDKSVAADRTLETLIKNHKFYYDRIAPIPSHFEHALDNVHGIICGEDDDPEDMVNLDSTYVMQIKPYVFGEMSISVHELQFRRT